MNYAEADGAALAVMEMQGKVFLRLFWRRADSSELAIISGRKLIKVAQSESMERICSRTTDRSSDCREERSNGHDTTSEEKISPETKLSALISPHSVAPLLDYSSPFFYFLSPSFYPSFHAFPIFQPHKNWRGACLQSWSPPSVPVIPLIITNFPKLNFSNYTCN